MTNFKNGQWSEQINAVMEKLDASPLTEVEKMEFQNMLHKIVAKSLALDVDSYVRKILLEKIKTEGKKLLDYESDLIVTQERIATLERDLEFHKKVLEDLKNEYLKTTDFEKQKELLEQIDQREKIIADQHRLYTQLIDIRNKIRKEIDRREYQEAQLQLQEREQIAKGFGSIKDINVKVLEQE